MLRLDVKLSFNLTNCLGQAYVQALLWHSYYVPVSSTMASLPSMVTVALTPDILYLRFGFIWNKALRSLAVTRSNTCG